MRWKIDAQTAMSGAAAVLVVPGDVSIGCLHE